MSELPIYLDPCLNFQSISGSQAQRPYNCFWGYCDSRTSKVPSSESATRRPRFGSGSKEVLQDGYRLALLPKLAFYALWDGHSESFVVPRATTGAEVALPIGSYTSAPVDNLDPQEMVALTFFCLVRLNQLIAVGHR